MLTVADMGGGGVKNGQKSADVLYGRSLIKNHMHESSMKLFHFNLIPALVDIEVSSSLWEKFLGTFDFS